MSKQAFREIILGAMKAKDTDGVGSIHASDFHNSVENLGLETGSDLIEEIMVQCKSNVMKYITFIFLVNFQATFILME